MSNNPALRRMTVFNLIMLIVLVYMAVMLFSLALENLRLKKENKTLVQECISQQ